MQGLVVNESWAKWSQSQEKGGCLSGTQADREVTLWYRDRMGQRAIWILRNLTQMVRTEHVVFFSFEEREAWDIEIERRSLEAGVSAHKRRGCECYAGPMCNERKLPKIKDITRKAVGGNIPLTGGLASGEGKRVKTRSFT